ncbi:MAG: universal stress protein [Burkholderiales bacterium]|jgi:nucleotide-binding universal stress UspA family protein
MGYKTIVVHLDCGSRRSERLDLALGFAKEFDAQLIGLFALDLYVGMPRTADAGCILVESELQRREACMREAKQEFFVKCAMCCPKAEWRFADEDAVAELVFAARSADLIVIGQTHPQTCAEDGVRASFASEVVLTAGKPVLIVPYAGHFEGIGKRTLVAWNTGREAGLALAASLPVLERSASVDVVSFQESGNQMPSDEEAGSAVKIYLQNHGVKATIRRCGCENCTAGELILAEAYDGNADCIVMGAYGKSRMDGPEGVTQTVMKFMTVPVIMSH